MKAKALLLLLPFMLIGCGKFTLPSYDEDIPKDVLNTYQKSEKTIVEEKMCMAPLLWFHVDFSRKNDTGYTAESFSSTLLNTYMAAKTTQYGMDGKKIFSSKWHNCLYGLLYGCYERKYLENKKWVEEKHKGFLLGLFGHEQKGEDKWCYVFFIPIKVS